MAEGDIDMTDLPDKVNLRPREVADYLNLSVRATLRLCESGKLEAVKINQRVVRITRISVLKLQKQTYQ
jgi:excisionase family DNA binding protein